MIQIEYLNMILIDRINNSKGNLIKKLLNLYMKINKTQLKKK